MIALSTGSLCSYGVARVFELAAKAGFDGIEVLVDDRWDTRQPDYLRRLSAKFGLPIVALHSPFAGQVAGWPDDQLGRLRRTVVLAQEVRAPVVVAHLPFRFYTVMVHVDAYRPRRFRLPLPIPRREPYYRFVADGLEAMEQETGVIVAVENMPARRLLGLTIDFYWYNSLAELELLPHVTLDTTHWGTWGLDPLAAYRRLREQVSHVHLSNYDGREHRSPPDGRLPLADLLQALAGDGYRGAVTVECHPGALDAEDEEKCLAALRRARRFCRTHYKWR